MEHLLAMLVEVTSVGVAGRKLKRPIEVPRPKPPKRRVVGKSEQDTAFKKGIGVLAATTRAVSR